VLFRSATRAGVLEDRNGYVKAQVPTCSWAIGVVSNRRLHRLGRLARGDRFPSKPITPPAMLTPPFRARDRWPRSAPGRLLRSGIQSVLLTGQLLAGRVLGGHADDAVKALAEWPTPSAERRRSRRSTNLYRTHRRAQAADAAVGSKRHSLTRSRPLRGRLQPGRGSCVAWMIASCALQSAGSCSRLRRRDPYRARTWRST
jgi:hypothetical protein